MSARRVFHALMPVAFGVITAYLGYALWYAAPAVSAGLLLAAFFSPLLYCPPDEKNLLMKPIFKEGEALAGCRDLQELPAGAQVKLFRRSSVEGGYVATRLGGLGSRPYAFVKMPTGSWKCFSNAGYLEKTVYTSQELANIAAAPTVARLQLTHLPKQGVAA